MSKTHATKDLWLSAMRSDGEALLAAVGQPDLLDVQVPSCPDWSVGELARHVGGVYRRTSRNVGSGDPAHSWGRVVVPQDAPTADDPAVVAWLTEEFAELEAALSAVEPHTPAWNWAPQSRVAGFWHRRMAHETAVHRWDAQLARGLPEPLESKLASDTVAEALDTFLPAGRHREKIDTYGLVHLLISDLGYQWTVRLRGAGVALLDTDTVFDDDVHPARASAAGPASDLALALWGRVALDVLETAGEPTLLKALRVR